MKFDNPEWVMKGYCHQVSEWMRNVFTCPLNKYKCYDCDKFELKEAADETG